MRDDVIDVDAGADDAGRMARATQWLGAEHGAPECLPSRREVPRPARCPRSTLLTLEQHGRRMCRATSDGLGIGEAAGMQTGAARGYGH